MDEDGDINVCVCTDDGFWYRVICQTKEDNEGYPLKLSEWKYDIVQQHKDGKNEKIGKGPPFESRKKKFIKTARNRYQSYNGRRLIRKMHDA